MALSYVMTLQGPQLRRSPRLLGVFDNNATAYPIVFGFWFVAGAMLYGLRKKGR